MKRATIIHDQVNLFMLPILGALTVAGLCHLVDPVKVTMVFALYIMADFAWIYVEPDAVPSMSNIILLHHAVTFALLCFPLRYHHLAPYTCWDGLCEINTFFLIARRQWKSVRKPLSALYWATFFPLRIFLYPYMLVQFYREMQAHALWELVAVCGSQIALIGFNLTLLSLSVMNWRKRSGKSREAAAASGNARVLSTTGADEVTTGGAGYKSLYQRNVIKASTTMT